MRSFGPSHDAYPQAPEHFRLYSSGIFGDIHSDLALSAGLELLSLEFDLSSENLVGERRWSINSQPRPLTPPARCLLEDDPDSYDLKSSLVVACQADGLRRSRIEAVGTRTCRAQDDHWSPEYYRLRFITVSISRPTFPRSRRE